jgi:hypothetical protein
MQTRIKKEHEWTIRELNSQYTPWTKLGNSLIDNGGCIKLTKCHGILENSHFYQVMSLIIFSIHNSCILALIEELPKTKL